MSGAADPLAEAGADRYLESAIHRAERIAVLAEAAARCGQDLLCRLSAREAQICPPAQPDCAAAGSGQPLAPTRSAASQRGARLPAPLRAPWRTPDLRCTARPAPGTRHQPRCGIESAAPAQLPPPHSRQLPPGPA